MHAIIWTRYGPPDVLQWGETETPVPKDNEILIRVRAATATTGDCEVRDLRLPGMIGLMMRLYIGVFKPTRIRIPGIELAGDVEAVGAEVTAYRPGDAVMAMSGLRFGAYAEYACVRATAQIAIKPPTISYEEAAGVPVGGSNGLHFIRSAHIRPGQRVLIIGAGGSIGHFAVQLAKRDGAEVTAIDRADKFDMLREIGADQVIDYTRQDFLSSDQTYDVIFDVVGARSLHDGLARLVEGGMYLNANPKMRDRMRAKRIAAAQGKRALLDAADHTSADLAELADLLESGALRSMVDRVYPLTEAAEAHRYVETGAKRGSVALSVA